MLVGIVGKPNVGKSTFFSALTLVDAQIANYPFTTIEPNKGIGFVRTPCADAFFNVQCNPRHGFCANHTRFVPVEIMDVAGLVPGAHEGKGLGNKFLDDLRQADVLIHVIDASGSTNEKGEVVEPGSHDPVKDVLFLEEEINLWFLGILNNNWQKMARTHYESKTKLLQALKESLSGLGVNENHLDKALLQLKLDEKPLIHWTESDKTAFARALREASKPIVIAANKMDLPSAEKNVQTLKEKFPNHAIIPCSAEAELSLKRAAKNSLVEYIPGSKEFKTVKELNERQREALELIRHKVLEKLEGTGVQKVLDEAVFHVLGYVAIFPGGVKKLADSQGHILPDCFLLPLHSTTLDFAFKLHTDIGKNFIKAINVKTRQLVGKDHELKNGDVIEIVFNK